MRPMTTVVIVKLGCGKGSSSCFRFNDQEKTFCIVIFNMISEMTKDRTSHEKSREKHSREREQV